MQVRFAISAGARPPEREPLTLLVKQADAIGFDAIWFSDLGILPSTDPLLSVAMAAACSDRVKLGMTIIPFGYTPYVFARQLAQADRLSSGRLRIMIVPGLDGPGERKALGIEGRDRQQLLDDLIPTLRALWAGEAPPPDPQTGVALPALGIRPVQQPLQIWLAGKGPKSIARAGRLGDGWRGGAAPPAEAKTYIDRIQQEAAAVGRRIDPENFGMTVAYARDEQDAQHISHFGEAPAAVGKGPLRELLSRLVDVGMSKFSLRRLSPVRAWRDELDWLADAVLDLQS